MICQQSSCYHRQLIWVVCVALVGTALAASASAQLPGESDLPGEKSDRTNVPTSPAVPIPSESELPGQPPTDIPPTQTSPNQAPPTQTPPTLPGEDRLPTTEPASPQQVPSEAELPAPSGNPPATDTGGGELPADPESPDQRLDLLRGSIDRQPWLRLQADGHLSTIRTIASSPAGNVLLSGGEDKQVLVWSRPVGADSTWPLQRTIRWQVQRGPRGRIYALDATDELVAMAGYGAMGGLAEIVIVDHRTGQLVTSLAREVAGQVVTGLQFVGAGDSLGLLSADVSGQLIYWRRDAASGQWSDRQVQPPDSETYASRSARPPRDYRFAAVLGDNWAVAPVVSSQTPQGNLLWTLQAWPLNDGDNSQPRPEWKGLELAGQVTAIAGTRDGSRLAVADEAGRVFVWDRTANASQLLVRLSALTLGLSFSGDGQQLLVATSRGVAAAQGMGEQRTGAQLQLWSLSNWSQPRRTAQRTFPDDIRACRLTADGRSFAVSQSNGLLVGSVAQLEGDVQRLGPEWHVPIRVAFAKTEPFYDLAIDYSGGDGKARAYQFSATELNLSDKRDEQRQWVTPDLWRGGWTVQVERAPAGELKGVWLEQAGRRAARLPLDPLVNGEPSATLWLPNPQGKPAYVVVATKRDNGLFVFGLADAGVAPLLRRYRGHSSTVTSLSVSFDMRYLSSASDDGTVCVWEWAPQVNRTRQDIFWGASFTPAGESLTVDRIKPNGPLYVRGLRNGDTLRRVWTRTTAGEVLEGRTAAAMRKILEDPPANSNVAFEYQRGNAQQPPMQAYAAWQPVASLYVGHDREWAYWSPTGYYDASFEGHRLFGWQINRGLGQLPEFFLAGQFRQVFERPDVMRRLLTAGDIENAFRVASIEPPANPHESLADYYRLKPEITIESPRTSGDVQTRTVQIVARVRVPAGQRLVSPEAFANGVQAGQPTLIAETPASDSAEYAYRWLMSVPGDEELLFQVIAATENEIADLKSVTLLREVHQPPKRRKIFIVAGGVNDYTDARIPDLEFAGRNAQELLNTVQSQMSTLYDVHGASLINDNMTRPMWEATIASLSRRASREAGPDDLLVIYLSGHGVRDQRTQEYYFIPHDCDYGQVMAGQYEGCISFADLASLAQIPCRKIVVLDTCHSGELANSVDRTHLKSAVRTLQDGLFFTFTASEGSQPSAESRELKMGRYTYRLVEGLRGAADGSQGTPDGLITLDELAGYVRTRVALDTASAVPPQNPTAGPPELLRISRIPLVQLNRLSKAE